MSFLQFLPILILIFVSVLCCAVAIVMTIHQRKSALKIEDEDFIDKAIKSKKKKIENNIGGISWKTYVSLLITCPLIFGIASSFVLQYKPLCLVFALIGLFVPELLINIFALNKKAKFEEKYAMSLKAMASSLRSGLTIEQAVESLANNPFIDDKVRSGFRQITSDIKVGISIEQAFYTFAENTKSEDAYDVAASIAMQIRVGGSESTVVSNIAKTINDRLMLRKEIKTLFSETSIMVYAMDIIPWLVMIMLFYMSPEYMSPYFENPILTVVLILILSIMTVGSFVIHKMAKSAKGG